MDGFLKVWTFVVALCLSPTLRANVTDHHFVDPNRKLNLHSSSTGWDFFDSEGEVQFIARAPLSNKDVIQPTLTLRIDKGDWPSSRSYSEKWLREYPKFGYDLQMSRQAYFGNLQGFEMEL